MWVLKKDTLVINVDSENELNRHLKSGWIVIADAELAAAGLLGCEHLAGPDTVTVLHDGSIEFTPPAPPPEPTIEERTEQFRAAIQSHLDVFAQTRNYDGIMSAASYATSTVEKFYIEGQYAVDVRDATWAKAYELLAEWMEGIQSGERGFPTDEEIFSELPALEWPNP